MRLIVVIFSFWLFLPQAFAQTAACSSLYSTTPAKAWLEERIVQVITSQLLNPKTPSLSKAGSRPAEVNVTEATRNALLAEAIYGTGLVEASTYSRLMSDKLFQVKYLSQVTPDVAAYFPRTFGFREFLGRHGLLTSRGQLSGNETQIFQAFQREFPEGFVVKPVAGYNTAGKGFYINEARVLVQDLLKDPNKFLGSDSSFLFSSPELGLASGEGWLVQQLLQAKVKGLPISGKPPEYRVHTYQKHVVPQATESRWLVAGEKNFPEVNAYVQKFLDRIPDAHLAKQAWGLDVVQLGPGEFRIIEINTNRGQPIQWSGYLLSGLQLGAHVRHWEAVGVLKLNGPTAEPFRRNRANLESWIRKEGRDAVIQDLRINDPELAREVENEI
ncbi:MAG: hypothetical protein ACK5P7_05460 [Bdellovibrio sp.]|jgi:hypothetical protein